MARVSHRRVGGIWYGTRVALSVATPQEDRRRIDLERLKHELEALFSWGSRYQSEKIGVIAAVVVLSVATLGWAFSASEETNELGAQIDVDTSMSGFNIGIVNQSGSDWRDVRVVVDRKYLYTTEVLESGENLTLGAEDFLYSYHIPRPWGRDGWEELSGQPKPDATPRESLNPTLIQVRAREGRIEYEAR